MKRHIALAAVGAGPTTEPAGGSHSAIIDEPEALRRVLVPQNDEPLIMSIKGVPLKAGSIRPMSIGLSKALEKPTGNIDDTPLLTTESFI
jgi:hypothetical protein